MSKKILIVEDHDESRFLYGEILRIEQFEVIETEDGRDALNYLSQNSPPNLIVMDLTFPYMTAREFVDELNKHPEWSKIPLVIISGQADTPAQASELKAASYIKKPFDLDPFIETIKQLTH